MALSVAQFAEHANWFLGTTPRGITGVAWSSGDIIVVIGGGDTAATTLGTPTNANLTFALQASSTTGGSGECSGYLWTATAGSAQTAQTIQGSRTAGGGNWGIGCWVVTGAPAGIANATANLTEAAISLTVAGGSVVVFGIIDFN